MVVLVINVAIFLHAARRLCRPAKCVHPPSLARRHRQIQIGAQRTARIWFVFDKDDTDLDIVGALCIVLKLARTADDAHAAVDQAYQLACQACSTLAECSVARN